MSMRLIRRSLIRPPWVREECAIQVSCSHPLSQSCRRVSPPCAPICTKVVRLVVSLAGGDLPKNIRARRERSSATIWYITRCIISWTMRHRSRRDWTKAVVTWMYKLSSSSHSQVREVWWWTRVSKTFCLLFLPCDTTRWLFRRSRRLSTLALTTKTSPSFSSTRSQTVLSKPSKCNPSWSDR